MASGSTSRRRLFIEHYLDCLNATEAARRAGYAKPMQEGWRLLRIAEIAQAVEAGLSEKAMGRTEVLTRLAEHARSDMREFIEFDENTGDTRINVSPDKPLHLIKKLEITKTTRNGEGDDFLIDTKIKIELYDAKTALDTLARHHALLVDRTEVSGRDGGAIQIQQFSQALDTAYADDSDDSQDAGE